MLKIMANVFSVNTDDDGDGEKCEGWRELICILCRVVCRHSLEPSHKKNILGMA